MRSKKLAAVDTGRCAACGACTNQCPKKAIAVWHGCYAVVSSEICVGCGQCAAVCPANCIAIPRREDPAV